MQQLLGGNRERRCGYRCGETIPDSSIQHQPSSRVSKHARTAGGVVRLFAPKA